MLAVRAPDGSLIKYGKYGRGSAGLRNVQISREQFEISRTADRGGDLILQNLGSNSLVLSREDDEGGEIILDLLEQGESAALSEGMFFYIPTLKEATTFFIVKSPSAGGPEAAQGNSHKRVAEDLELGQVTKRARVEEWIAPFSLLRVQGIPTAANKSPLGMRLRDVVSGDMKWVLVSNFEVDFGWLLSACPHLTRAEKIVLVHGESDPATVKCIREEARRAGIASQERLTIHAPPLPISYGTHHSKAFVIEYTGGLRVVVHTANLLHCDNNNKSQGLWVQDFPRKDAESPASSSFEADLIKYLGALKLPQDAAACATRICKTHDFSSARVQLIPSTPGYHTGDSMKSVGHLRLRLALQKEPQDPIFRNAPVFCQFSSLGSLDEKWLHSEFKSTLAAAPGGTGTPKALQLIWPTSEEVQNSVEGWGAGRSIPGFTKNVSKPFLRLLFHRFGGEPMGRSRAMPHIKTFGRYCIVPGQGSRLAWLLLASHNLSKAAWGTLQKKETQLMVRSYELGVLFLPSLESKYRCHRHCGFSCTREPPIRLPGRATGETPVEFWAADNPDGPNVHTPDRLCFPLPYLLPPKPYSGSDVPWMVDHAFPGVDMFGRTIAGMHVVPLYGHVEAD